MLKGAKADIYIPLVTKMEFIEDFFPPSSQLAQFIAIECIIQMNKLEFKSEFTLFDLYEVPPLILSLIVSEASFLRANDDKTRYKLLCTSFHSSCNVSFVVQVERKNFISYITISILLVVDRNELSLKI